MKPKGHTCSTSPYSCDPRIWLENSSREGARENVKVKEFYIGERRNLIKAYKRFGYFLYCQLIYSRISTFFVLVSSHCPPSLLISCSSFIPCPHTLSHSNSPLTKVKMPQKFIIIFPPSKEDVMVLCYIDCSFH